MINPLNPIEQSLNKWVDDPQLESANDDYWSVKTDINTIHDRITEGLENVIRSIEGNTAFAYEQIKGEPHKIAAYLEGVVNKLQGKVQSNLLVKFAPIYASLREMGVELYGDKPEKIKQVGELTRPPKRIPEGMPTIGGKGSANGIGDPHPTRKENAGNGSGTNSIREKVSGPSKTCFPCESGQPVGWGPHPDWVCCETLDPRGPWVINPETGRCELYPCPTHGNGGNGGGVICPTCPTGYHAVSTTGKPPTVQDSRGNGQRALAPSGVIPPPEVCFVSGPAPYGDSACQQLGGNYNFTTGECCVGGPDNGNGDGNGGGGGSLPGGNGDDTLPGGDGYICVRDKEPQECCPPVSVKETKVELPVCPPYSDFHWALHDCSKPEQTWMDEQLGISWDGVEKAGSIRKFVDLVRSDAMGDN
jgi:hypothetical protein